MHVLFLMEAMQCPPRSAPTIIELMLPGAANIMLMCAASLRFYL